MAISPADPPRIGRPMQPVVLTVVKNLKIQNGMELPRIDYMTCMGKSLQNKSVAAHNREWLTQLHKNVLT